MKEIIIDGVNVAECQCFENDKCLWCKKYYESNITPNCEQVKDCYYKQLQRFKQENEGLKQELELSLREEQRWKSNFNNYKGTYKAQCEKLTAYKHTLEEIRGDL